MLHRPRTLLKPEGREMGRRLSSSSTRPLSSGWGGNGNGYHGPAEHGIHIDAKGFVWITGNNCPTNGIAVLNRRLDDSNRQFTRRASSSANGRTIKAGNADTQRPARRRRLSARAPTRCSRRRVLQRPLRVFDARRAPSALWGALALKAFDDDSWRS